MLIPLGWEGASDYQPDEALTTTSTFLSPSYCVWEGEGFALRMRLPLQMRRCPQRSCIRCGRA